MSEIRFQAVVGADQEIRPPAGVTLPEGKVDVIVRRPFTPPSSNEDDFTEMREWLVGLAREAESIEGELPSDMAENHDHYAYGKHRSSTRRSAIRSTSNPS